MASFPFFLTWGVWVPVASSFSTNPRVWCHPLSANPVRDVSIYVTTLLSSPSFFNMVACWTDLRHFFRITQWWEMFKFTVRTMSLIRPVAAGSYVNTGSGLLRLPTWEKAWRVWTTWFLPHPVFVVGSIRRCRPARRVIASCLSRRIIGDCFRRGSGTKRPGTTPPRAGTAIHTSRTTAATTPSSARGRWGTRC